MLVNNHDPKHLREEFEADYAGGYDWKYVQAGPRVWRIRIARLAGIALPGALVWLPRRCPRRFSAGADGLRYLGAHQRRQAPVLVAPARQAVS